MTSEEALQLIEATLESKKRKPLTPLEKEILKAAWDRKTYTHVAESLYLSLGYIKDLAAALWQRLSNVFEEKITKHNFRRIMEEQNTKLPSPEENSAKNDSQQNEDTKGNLLIIDNSIENLEFLTKVLSKRGYRVRGVTSGKMALIIIRHHQPDVILLNVEMPPMESHEVCQALKSDEAASEIPIILLNSRGEVANKLKVLKVGEFNRIIKPFELEEAIARSQTQPTIQQQRDQLRKQIEQHQKNADILYQSRTLLENLLNCSKYGIAAWEAVRDTITEEIKDFRCLMANPVFAKLLGQQREDLIGKTIDKKAIAKLTPTLFDSLVQVVEMGQEVEQEFYWENDDQQIWYCLNAVKFADGCSITVRNITNFKLLEFRMKLGAHFQ